LSFQNFSYIVFFVHFSYIVFSKFYHQLLGPKTHLRIVFNITYFKFTLELRGIRRTAQARSGNLKNSITKVSITKMIPNILGAHAHFSTTQQLFSSSSDPKKQTCCISK